jgi:hypothetical protein
MSRSQPANVKLYLVTTKNLDGTTKTVLKSRAIERAISNYELTRQQINTLWLAGQADLPGDRGPIPAIVRRRIALFTPHNRTDPNSITLSKLDDEQREHARRIALALNLQDNSDFLHPTVNILDDVLDAALNGDEAIVRMMLKKNPLYLLARGNATHSSGRAHENITPLQAAIIANDVQMVEMMKPYFERLTTDLAGNPIDGLASMDRQIKETYKLSLRKYLELQKIKIASLEASQEYGLLRDQAIGHLVGRAQHQYNVYWNALKSDDISEIFKVYSQAQENNAFDFRPYVDAIINAPQAELDDVMALINARTKEETDAVIARTGVANQEADECRALPFDRLTLVQKLNRFREKLVEHMRNEIIFNPNHILAGLKHNEQTWDEVDAGRIVDQNYRKVSAIFSHLVGKAQREAYENVRQDIRQGTWYLTEQNETRTRQSRFNDFDPNYNVVRNSLVDISLADSSSIDGIGYRFAAWRAAARGRQLGEGALDFSKLLSSKNIKLGEFMQRAPTAPAWSPCVVQ